MAIYIFFDFCGLLWVNLAIRHRNDDSLGYTHPLNPPPQGRGKDKVNHHPTREGAREKKPTYNKGGGEFE